MNSVVFLTLRRLRTPLLILIAVYSIGITGLVLIPGIDAEGKTANLSFFQAFYFMSYTASTIGFGEIPYAFTDKQRLWVTLVIYLSVIGWAYTVAALLALARDTGFRNAVTRTTFRRRVRRIGEPFYVICGCGETGAMVCRGLDQLGIRFVVLDIDEARVEELDLYDFRSSTPALAADARLPENMMVAGIAYSNCRGVIALTNDDEANLAAAIAVKLLNTRIPVLCRAMRPEVAANMESFGTDHIINPFREFGEHLSNALRVPADHALLRRLTGLPGSAFVAPKPLPRGRWIVCGYGRFGREVEGAFAGTGLSMAIVDPDPPPGQGERFVRGLGTEAPTLLEAGVEDAVGIVAGTDNDINNLSIAMTARALNPKLFVVMRQNLQANRALFRAFRGDMTMIPAQIIANECLALISTPLLDRFLKRVTEHDEAWSEAMSARLERAIGAIVPSIWSVTIDAAGAPAVLVPSRQERDLGALGLLLCDPTDRDQQLQCVPLLLSRSGGDVVVPESGTLLLAGDAILFAGTAEARSRQNTTLRNANVHTYVKHGIDVPGGWVWQWLARRQSEGAEVRR